MSKRYTAVLKVIEIDDGENGAPRRLTSGKKEDELLSVTFRSKSLETVKAHLTAHVELMTAE